MIENILKKIYEYRLGVIESVNVDLSEIKDSVQFLWDTQYYRENFNEVFLATSESFYSDYARKFSSSMNIVDYIAFIERAIDGETRLVNNYMFEHSLKKLILLLERRTVFEHKDIILKNCFETEDLFSANWVSLLKRVYLLFKKVKNEEEIRKSWLQYISRMSNKIFTVYSKNSKSLFISLFDLKKNIDMTLNEAFLSEEKFRSVAKEGFAKSINLKPNFIADHFSRYIDLIFKESDKEEKKIESNIDDFMTIFKFLDAKDMFETFFIRRLATRLLYKLTSSKKGEKYLIEKLRTECGSAFVNKSEEMLADTESSADMTLDFTSTVSSIHNFNFSFNFLILSSLSWPVQKIQTASFSSIPKVERLNNLIYSYFIKKNQGKTSKWHLPYCTAEVTFNISKLNQHMNYELELDGTLFLVLMMFNQPIKRYNDNNVVSLNKILDTLKLDRDECLLALSTLVNHWKILKEENGYYKLNINFTHSKHRVSFSEFNKDETGAEEVREVEERNTEDRKYVVDAHLMKILKQKKVMKSIELIQGVIESVKFPCEVSFVNTRISFLVDRENIKVDEKDETLLRYN